MKDLITAIKTSIVNKDEKAFETSIDALCLEIGKDMDEHIRNAFVKSFQFHFKGSKGRIASPFTEVKEVVNPGQRGRPALSESEKSEKLKMKLKKQLDELEVKTA